MRRMSLGGLTAVLAVAALTAFASSAGAVATLTNLTTGGAVPNGASLQLRSASIQTLTFPGGGTISCRHSYAVLGVTSVTNNTMTNIWTRIGLQQEFYFGDFMPLGTVAATPCATAGLGIGSCKLQAVPAANGSVPGRLSWLVDARDDRAASNSISVRFTGPGTVINQWGAIVSLVPITLQADCVPAGGGAPVRCYYTAGTAVNAPAVTEGKATFVGAPSTASTIVFTDQPFYRDSTAAYAPPGAPGCPGAGPGAGGPAKFNGSVQLFTGGVAGSPQVGAR